MAPPTKHDTPETASVIKWLSWSSRVRQWNKYYKIRVQSNLY